MSFSFDIIKNNQLCKITLEETKEPGDKLISIEGRDYKVLVNEEDVSWVRSHISALDTSKFDSIELFKASLQHSGPTEKTHRVFHETINKPDAIESERLAAQKQIIEDICSSFEEKYIFPDVAKNCSRYLRQQLNDGAYSQIFDNDALSAAITADIRLISEDKHIWVDINPITETPSTDQIGERYSLPELLNTYTYQGNGNPYEIQSGILKDNPKVGYIDLRSFGKCQTREANHEDEENEILKRREEIIAAVQNLKGTESIMIDLRNNGGGRPTAVQFICSLFIEENFPLNRIVWRDGENYKTDDFNTLSHQELSVDKRLFDSTLFVLIGPHTFSAAEEFSNNMKVLGRATIVGEPSGGGANPTESFTKGNVTMYIPTGRAFNPIQQGNWEGVGIIPDELVPAEKALVQALKSVSNSNYPIFQIRDSEDKLVGHVLATQHFTDEKALLLNQTILDIIEVSSHIFMEQLGDIEDENLANTTITDLIIRDFQDVELPDEWTEEKIAAKLDDYQRSVKEHLPEQSSDIEQAFDNYPKDKQLIFYAAIFGLGLASHIKLGVNKLYDDHLTAKAASQSKKIQHLESDEIRIRRQAENKQNLTARVLSSLNEDIKMSEPFFLTEKTAWEDGDLETLNRLYGGVIDENEEAAVAFVATLHVRNRDMAEKIKQFAKPDSEGHLPLFVVGIAHLVDVNSNIGQFLEGHKITQITFS